MLGVYKWQATIRCRAPWGQHLGDPSIGMGTLAAIIHGTGFPLIMLVFGDMTDSFAGAGSFKNITFTTSLQGCFWNVRASLGRASMRRAIRKAGVRIFTSSRITGPSFLSGSTQCAASVPTGNGAGRGAAADGRARGNPPVIPMHIQY